MAKDAFWFKHDSNSRTDVKLVKLRRKSGLEGVGLFWCVVEMLRESENYELDLSCSDDIIYDLRTTESVFESLFECNLLEKGENTFYSESLKGRMLGMDKVREKRKLAGSKGGKAKAIAKKNVANATAVLKQKSSKALAHPSEESRREEKRVEESKEDIKTTTPKKQACDYSSEFLGFWEFYKKGNKKKAFDQWKKLKPSQVDEIRNKVSDYVKSTDHEGGRYRKNAEVYLNPVNEHWNNEIQKPKPKGGQPERDEYKEPDFNVDDFLIK